MASEETDEDCAIFATMCPPEIIKSTPRTPFPIHVSDQGPKPFDLTSQARVMRWKHLFAFCWFPVWEIEPDMELIKEVARDHLNTCGFDNDTITVEYFAGGTHNKLYTINTKDLQTGQPAQCLFRIAMPIYPWYKVESDVATTEFVRHFTDVPVPIIYAYDSSTDNKLGLEWMLIEKVSGKSLEEEWTDISLKRQTELTVSVADWVHQLSSFAFDKIGSLYMRNTESTLDFYIGPMVESHFYDGRRLTYTIDRGPFTSLQSYYDAILDVQQQEVKDVLYLADYQRLIRAAEYKDSDHEARKLLKAKLAQSPDSAYGSDEERMCGAESTTSSDISEPEIICDNTSSTYTAAHVATCAKALESRGPGDVEDIFEGRVLMFRKNMLAQVPRLLETLRNALPSLVEEPGGTVFTTMLMHHDISTDNILVDRDGETKALVDWEMVCLHPPILKTPIPHFLDSFENSEFPRFEEMELWGEADFLRNCKTYILTKLRKSFRERLEELQSRYLLIFEDPSDLHSALYERIFDRGNHHGSQVQDWVEVQLAPTDDESDYRSEDESDNGVDGVVCGPMSACLKEVELEVAKVEEIEMEKEKEKEKDEKIEVEKVEEIDLMELDNEEEVEQRDRDLMELDIEGDDNKLAIEMARVAEVSIRTRLSPVQLWLYFVELVLLWSG